MKMKRFSFLFLGMLIPQLLTSTNLPAEEGFFSPLAIQAPFSLELGNLGLIKIDFNFNGTIPTSYANAFFISSSGTFLLNHHVADGCIQEARKNRGEAWYDRVVRQGKGYTSNSTDPGIACENFRGWIQSPRLTENFRFRLTAIPRNVGSATENDFVIAQSDRYVPRAYFQLASRHPEIEEKVFSLSYAPSTERKTTAIITEKYKNGDGTFRVSVGKFRRNDPNYDYAEKEKVVSADIDGLAGSSGSPLLNLKGEVIGILMGPGSASKEAPLCSSLVKDFCEGLIAHVSSLSIRPYLRRGSGSARITNFFPTFPFMPKSEVGRM
jgi:hypothetical protein